MTLFEELDQALGLLPVVRGILPADLLDLPESIGESLGKMVRNRSILLKEFAAEVGLPETEALHLMSILVAKGYVVEEEQEEPNGIRYHANFAQIRSRHLPLDL